MWRRSRKVRIWGWEKDGRGKYRVVACYDYRCGGAFDVFDGEVVWDRPFEIGVVDGHAVVDKAFGWGGGRGHGCFEGEAGDVFYCVAPGSGVAEAFHEG